MRSRLPLLLLLVAAPLLFSGCEVFSSPQNTFAPAGEVAQKQKDWFILTMWFALAILILVEGMIIYIGIRFREKKGDTGLPKQTHGNNRLEIAWTIAPAILLAAFVPLVVGGIVELGRTPKDAQVVKVEGLQWQWFFTHVTADGTEIPEPDANVLHVPIDRNVEALLSSPDVIHSFWIPKLAGKTDVVPGRHNHMWFKGTEVGTFDGQCAEFCGLGHPDMKFKVVVQTQEEFDAWLQSQAAAQPAAGAAELAEQGD